MIDIHTHILPGVDDGAEDMDDALAMARMAVEDGTTTMIASSHSAEWFEIGNLDEMKNQVGALQAALDEAEIGLKVVPGMEIYLLPETPKHLKSGRAWTLAGSRYVLVELPYDIWPTYTERILFDLQIAGYMPILAHPERCSAIQKDLNVMYKLSERGILGQVTSLALIGKQSPEYKACAEQLVTHQLVQFLASDTHDVGKRFGRVPGMSAGLAALTELIGEEAAVEMATTNPQHVLDNRPLATDPIEYVPPKKGFFSKLLGR